MTTFLVFGRYGQLAQALARQENTAGVTLKFMGSKEFNLENRLLQISKLISKFGNIDGVINTAAYTNVDKAEHEDCQRAYVLNVQAPVQMAKACRAQNLPFLHVSTDCVFGGDKRAPYTFDDQPSPVNFYGFTKLLGERAIADIGGRSCVFRTSWVFSPQGKNFFTVMLGLGRAGKPIKVVDDQIGSPTYADDLALALLHAGKHMAANPRAKLPPLTHISGKGAPVSRYDFARAIFSQAGLPLKISPISSAAFGAPAQRPAYCALDTAKFEATFSYQLPKWRAGLKRALAQSEDMT